VVILRRGNNEKLCPILSSKIMAQTIEEVPVIIQFNEVYNNLRQSIKSFATSLKSELSIIDGYAGEMSTDMIYRLSTSPEVDYISFDSQVYTQLDISTAAMEAYFPHDKGFEGEGITVAVIDTGVAPHDDLIKPINRIVDFKDFVNNKKTPYDDNGHGTHVAGIIASNGYSSRGKLSGIAPKANIVGIKALDENGGGSTSDIISAISYVIENKDRLNIKLINLSLGTPATNPSNKDPLCKAVDRAISEGLIVVTAAGNSGPNENTILSPGVNKNVITVGAVDDKRTIDIKDDTIAKFSSRGPTKEGINKPDLVAPGVNIKSLSNTKLDSYSSLSGTSMATPLVTGSIALLLNKDNNLTHNEVKNMLIKSCLDLNNSPDSQGAGMLNLKALFQGDSVEKNEVESISGNRDDLLESLVMLLIIFFLLDSKI
jgi:serine protease AprX